MSRKMSRLLVRISSIVSSGATAKSILPQKRIFVGTRMISTSTGRALFRTTLCLKIFFQL